MSYDFNAPVPKEELKQRLEKFREKLTQTDKNWSTVLINNPINIYYFAGCIPEGVLLITKTDAVLFVRKDFNRVCKESLFEKIVKIISFKTVAQHLNNKQTTIYLEFKYVTVQWLNLLKKYISFENQKDITKTLQQVKMIKSPYEIECLKQSGKIHAQSLENTMPSLLKEGISEAELCSQILLDLIKRGSMGICRFENPHGEPVGGFCAFSESSTNGMSFDSPDGCLGTYIPMQALGSNKRKLKKGDIVFADIACEVAGYHTDKSVVFFYGKLSEHKYGEIIKEAYNICLQIEQKISKMLKPNANSTEIYQTAYEMVPEKFQNGFMFGKNFIGHSLGLAIDEPPVISPLFNFNLIENQVFAIEPKIVLENIGTVGTENTYLVTKNGGLCLTGKPLPLKEIY